MNKIVLDHYPVSKLPEDLREGLRSSTTVRIVIEEEPPSTAKPMTAVEAMEAIKAHRKKGSTISGLDDAVSRIRELRDEWEN